MDTGRKRRLMNGHWLVEIEVLPDGRQIVLVFEKVEALKDIRLFDEARPEDTVPRPFLIDRPVFRSKIGHGPQFLVEETILLEEQLALGILRIIHLFDDFPPL